MQHLISNSKDLHLNFFLFPFFPAREKQVLSAYKAQADYTASHSSKAISKATAASNLIIIKILKHKFIKSWLLQRPDIS